MLLSDQAVSVLVISGIAGAIGGMVAGVNLCTPNRIRLPRIYRHPAKQLRIRKPASTRIEADSSRLIDVELGFIGDALIGCVAGAAIHLFLASVTIGESVDKPVDQLKIVAICLLSGIASKRALSRMSDMFINRVFSEQESLAREQNRISNRLELLSRAHPVIVEGQTYLEAGESAKDESERRQQYELAETQFRRAIEIDASFPIAWLSLGKVLKRRAQGVDSHNHDVAARLFQEAINAVSRAISLDPLYDRAYYNRACYHTLTGHVAEAIADLDKAIRIFEHNRTFASHDSDFDSIRTNPAFIALVR